MESRNIYGSTSGFIYYNPITGRTYRIAGGNPNPTNNVPSTSRNTQNQREPEKRSSGFGYFLAAIVGFAAALITKSLLYDEPE